MGRRRGHLGGGGGSHDVRGLFFLPYRLCRYRCRACAAIAIETKSKQRALPINVMRVEPFDPVSFHFFLLSLFHHISDHYFVAIIQQHSSSSAVFHHI